MWSGKNDFLYELYDTATELIKQAASIRRVIAIAMGIFGFSMVITGVMKLFPPFNSITFPAHIINSIIFGVLAIIHTFLNWKPLGRYFKGLGWWWILVGLGYLLVIWSVIVMPIFIINGVW